MGISEKESRLERWCEKFLSDGGWKKLEQVVSEKTLVRKQMKKI